MELEELLGLTDICDNSQEIKQKTYYDIEQELIETKHKLEILENKMKLLLERKTPSFINLTLLESEERNVYKQNLINLNCETIKIIYDNDNVRPKICMNNITNGHLLHGFTIYYDNAEFTDSEFNDIDKFINLLQNINSIEIEFKKRVIGYDDHEHVKKYIHNFMETIYKKLVKINKNLIIIINIRRHVGVVLPLNLLKYLFENIVVKNISSIQITIEVKDEKEKKIYQSVLQLLPFIKTTFIIEQPRIFPSV
jgi:hypothetical protein